jgi:ABC-2 type transport system permease protein
MSAAVAVPTLDVSGTHRVPLTRHIKVEVRKMADTRAGMWLLIAIGAISALVIAGFFIWGNAADRTFLDLLAYAGIPQSILLPVLGILLITSEWGQRTALVTFTQEPARSRILLAKLAAAVIFVLAALAVAAASAAVLAPLGGSSDPWDDVTLGLMSRIVLALIIGIVWGLAFGAAFLNSAFAIVLYFLVPTIISIVGGIWESVGEKILWFDLGTTQGMLFDSSNTLDGKYWAQLSTGLLLWVVLPGAFGVWRILRSEVK